MSTPTPDTEAARGPFADWAEVYRRRGYWPRPITPGTKACHVREWQKPDFEFVDATLASWLTSHAHFGIGLLMGSPFLDGTTLGAIDIDRDEYVRIGRVVLRDPPSGRIGKKGAVFFVRVHGPLSNPEFKARGDDGKRYGRVAECLFTKLLCIIPPTIHPETGQPYRWIGRPLHEVSFDELPVVEMKRAELMAAYDRGAYASRQNVTVADAVAAWLETKRSTVRPITFATYAFQSRYVVGPLATSEGRREVIVSGKGKSSKPKPIELLGREKAQELTTRRIRAWHKLLSEEVSIYCANKAMQLLKAALALAAEDHEFRPPAMPTGLRASTTRRARPCSLPKRSRSF